jgi:hypothetical protein
MDKNSDRCNCPGKIPMSIVIFEISGIQEIQKYKENELKCGVKPCESGKFDMP